MKLAALAAVFAGTVFGAVSKVAVSGPNQGTASSASVTISLTGANTLVVFAGRYAGSGPVTVSDTQNTGLSLAASAAYPGDDEIRVYVAGPLSSSGADTITISGANTYPVIEAWTLSGVDNTAGLTYATHASQTGNANTGSITPYSPNGIWIAATIVSQPGGPCHGTAGVNQGGIVAITGAAFGYCSSYAINPGASPVSETFQGLPSSTDNAAVIISFKPGDPPNCTLTTGSPLVSRTTGVTYSQTLATIGCAAPVFRVSSGALPKGLTLNPSTGAITGTPAEACSPCEFQISLSDANPAPESPYTLDLTIAAADSPVFVTGPNCAAASSSSAACTATTNVPVSVSVDCGTAAGPSGTLSHSTTVYGWRTDNVGWWGQTSFSVAATGLVASATQYCYVTIQNANGASLTSSAQTVTTPAVAATTPIAIASVSPPTRINDQYDGSHGMPHTGVWIDGDTQYNTWADDGNVYGSYQDGIGVNGTQIGGIGFLRWDAAHVVPTQLQSLNGGAGGNPYSEQGYLSVRGAMYAFLSSGYGGEPRGGSGNSGPYGQTCCLNVIKTNDHWSTSLNYLDNTGPGAAGSPGIHMPPVLSSAIAGSSQSAGVLTLNLAGDWTVTPPQVTTVFISGAVGCSLNTAYLTTATTANSVTISSNASGCTGGTVQYQPSMYQRNNLPGDSGVYASLPSPIQPCQDYSVNCTAVANMDGWVYLFLHYKGLARVRIEDLPLQDIAKYQCYSGNQDGDDGLYDVNWQPLTTGPCKALTSASGLDPYAYMASSANKGHIAYIPDFNRFLLSVYIGANNCALGSAIYDLGPYPWGKPVRIGAINRDLRFPGLCPGFPNPLLSSYRKTSSDPLTASITWVTSGGSFKGSRNGSTDNYSPFLWPVRLTTKGVATRRPLAPGNRARGQHVSSGLKLYYDFQDLTGANQIPNLSPNDPTGAWTYTSTGDPPVNDQYGLILSRLSGSDNTTDGVSWTGQQENTALLTPYNAQLNDFTAFVCFGHNPYQFNGITINDGQVGEQVVTKNGGDFTIARHGSTFGPDASWDVSVHSTLAGTVAIPDGTLGCIGVRVNSGTAAVYQTSAGDPASPLTFSAGPATVPRSGSTGNVVLGGSKSLWGVLSELLIYNRALSDAEMLQEASAIQQDMALRTGLGNR